MKARDYIKFVLLFILLTLASCGRNMNRQEQSCIQKLNKILEWPECGYYSDEVMRSVFDIIKNNPHSLEYEFEEELPHIRIVTSDDGNVRAYSLERYGFEGNPSLGFECKTMLQYRSGKTVFCDEVEDFNGYISQILHVDSNKFYLLEDYQGSIHQGTYENFTFYVYKIENNKLHKVKGAFLSRDGISDNIALSWDDWGGQFAVDEEYSAFVYNKFRKELYVLKGMPLAGESLKYRQYNWNKRRFELEKDDEPAEYRNDKYFIRIEQQGEDVWTYKCWNGGQKQGKPDLVIEKGTKEYWLYDNTLISHDEWWTDDECSPLGEKYTFFNNGYRYEYYHGWSRGMQLEELFVYDPDETLVFSGDFEPVFQP